MALNTTLTSAQVLNASITDTAVHNGVNFLMDYLEDTTILATSTLNQSVTLATQISFDDGATWANYGSTYSLAAGGSVVANQYDPTLTGIKAIKGVLRVTATCSVAPSSGTLTIWMQGMGND